MVIEDLLRLFDLKAISGGDTSGWLNALHKVTDQSPHGQAGHQIGSCLRGKQDKEE